MPARSRLSLRWKIATRCCAAVPKISMKASGPFSKSESLSISGDNKKSAKDREFRETQYEWECGRGDFKTGLSQDRMAGARYRGRAAARRRDRAEVADSAEGLREAHPGLAGEMGERDARPYLAGEI